MHCNLLDIWEQTATLPTFNWVTSAHCNHTSYLSQSPQAMKKKSAMWRIFLHIADCDVEKFSTNQIVSWRNVSTWDMWSKICFFLHNLCWFVAKLALLPITLFFCGIYSVAIYVLLRGDKLNQKFYLWRKMTNVRYDCNLLDIWEQTAALPTSLCRKLSTIQQQIFLQSQSGSSSL